MKKLLLITTVFIIIISNFAFAEQKAGLISEFTGKVQIYDGISPRPADVSDINTPVFVKNKISTKRNSAAVLDLLGGDRIALDSQSMMTINDIEEFTPESGKVIFDIRKRGTASGIKVAVKSAVIGVKGTKFLVQTEDSGRTEVYLKEGQLEVTSTEGQFKKYLEVEMDEYEAYVKKMAGEYEDYLKKLEEEFVEFVESFIMEEGSAFSIDGKEVRKVEITKEINDAFDLLDGVKNSSGINAPLSKETDKSPPAAKTPVKQKEEPAVQAESDNSGMKNDGYDDLEKEFEMDFDDKSF